MTGEPLTILILAGGRSRRMGKDKAWLEMGGQPLVERVTRRVLPLASEIIFSAASAEPFTGLARALPVPVQVVADRHPGAGPLAGLYAGIDAAQYDLVLALATDLPFVNLVLLQQMIGLAEGYDAVVPLVSDRRSGELMKEPMHALYRRTCLPAIAAHLAASDFQAFSFLPDVHARFMQPEEIARLDPTYLSFLNVNTPEDWAAAQQLLLSQGQDSDGARS
jgi:molybdopterin-guanine dinucleotide biosynthesis protein A